MDTKIVYEEAYVAFTGDTKKILILESSGPNSPTTFTALVNLEKHAGFGGHPRREDALAIAKRWCDLDGEL